ncbi:hypothetical protein CAI21_17940 [Alkalilimnicola ehrlichii]|uniref:PilZ domain-containing protein n=1 Tax=Alkalilimnicola ehrlichii TaxID=351052 RepID=A0A3E0WMB1_9GAMM|nr:PilZ domain-containing protein [Alkalilimnicola ehrlichii]RFA25840.1 hypothetical protein CAI21_17940 [Alkalilimnicola ehrlichii]RFA33106.1 hypothetical protein CAL65_18245 [Alkalilimnicola ehrlichii]
MNLSRDMEEKRNTDRKLVRQLLRVMDRNNHAVLGNLVNLSPEGFMLISPNALVEGGYSELELELPKIVNGRSRIAVDARCIWCQKSSYSDDYGAGFQIERIPEQDMRALRMVFGGI